MINKIHLAKIQKNPKERKDIHIILLSLHPKYN